MEPTKDAWDPTQYERFREQRAQPFRDLVALVRPAPGMRVLDLGCGVGTAALWLAERRPVEVVGVSISPAQVRMAGRFAARSGPLRGRVRFALADFTALPEDLRGFDLAFAIESFVHADPAAAFFGQAGRALRPQMDALDQLRSGARELMQQMMDQMAQQQGEGEGSGEDPSQVDSTAQQARDPAGRPLNNGLNGLNSSDVNIPAEAELQRSREILEELLRRAGERFRPQLERDYIERLLRRF